MAKKRKHKKRYSSVFAPLFPNRMGTPRSIPVGNIPGAALDGGSAASLGATSPGIGDSIIPPSRRRTLFEMRQVFSEAADPAWTGYSAPSPAISVRQGIPQPNGAGFQPVDAGQGGRYDFKKSPGLGFRSAKAWRVWGAILDILTKNPSLPIYTVLQGATARAGVKSGEIDSAEMRLIEMGIQWYLSDPSKFTNNKTSDGGGQSGIGATQLNPSSG